MNQPDIKDPKYWKCSMFYYNPNDPNRYVPRPEGLGLSPNYAHPDIYFIVGAALAIIVTLIFFL